MSFRRKDIEYKGKMMPYVMTLKIQSSDGQVKEHTIIRPNSVFYALFMSRAGYVDGCYSCKYANPDKPGDLTLGDYKPTDVEKQYYGLDENIIYSTVMVNTELGHELLNKAGSYIKVTEVPFKMLINHHHNLIHPSITTSIGHRYYSEYQKGGFKRLNRYITISQYKNKSLSLVKRVYRGMILTIVKCFS